MPSVSSMPTNATTSMRSNWNSRRGIGEIGMDRIIVSCQNDVVVAQARRCFRGRDDAVRSPRRGARARQIDDMLVEMTIAVKIARTLVGGQPALELFAESGVDELTFVALELLDALEQDLAACRARQQRSVFKQIS